MTYLERVRAAMAVIDAMPRRGVDPGPSEAPSETTATPRDPDGLLAENAWSRQQEWFE